MQVASIDVSIWLYDWFLIILLQHKCQICVFYKDYSVLTLNINDDCIVSFVDFSCCKGHEGQQCTASPGSHCCGENACMLAPAARHGMRRIAIRKPLATQATWWRAPPRHARFATFSSFLLPLHIIFAAHTPPITHCHTSDCIGKFLSLIYSSNSSIYEHRNPQKKSFLLMINRSMYHNYTKFGRL